jgi:hypothetical protein
VRLEFVIVLDLRLKSTIYIAEIRVKLPFRDAEILFIQNVHLVLIRREGVRRVDPEDHQLPIGINDLFNAPKRACVRSSPFFTLIHSPRYIIAGAAMPVPLFKSVRID